MNQSQKKTNRRTKKAFIILRLCSGILFSFSLLLIFGLTQKYRLNMAKSKSELIMHNYKLLDEKMQFVEGVAAETGWVQNMSMLDTQGFEAVFPLDLYDAQASIRNYNALIGFSCETMVFFDNSDYALTASGALTYKELVSCFDPAINFNVYTKSIYGNVRYVRNSGVVSSVIYYNCPNKLNGYNFRLIFIVEENYLLNYLGEAGNIDTNMLFIGFSGNEIFAGKDYRNDRGIVTSTGSFVFGYNQRFPIWMFLCWVGGTLLVFGAVYALIYFKINDYYDSMQTYMRKLNDLVGKPYTEESSGGITRRFGEILSEISKVEMQSKSVLSDDFTKLVEEYISSIVHSGETLNEEACRGLRRLGVAADKNIAVVYIGRAKTIDKTGFGEFYDLGDAIMLIDNNHNIDMDCVYGQSNYYRGLEYAATAFFEAEEAYETSVFYERKNVRFSQIGKFADLPQEAENFNISLCRLLMTSEHEEIDRQLKTVKEALLRAYIAPETLSGFFGNINDQLLKIEKEQRIVDGSEENGDEKSIAERIEEILWRSARIAACFRQKKSDRYSYYFTVIKSYVDKNFCDPDISLASVADEFGYSVAYVSKIFTEKGNISYSDYINSLRMEKAKKMLEETDLSVNVIAARCGVLSPVTFRRVFKKYTNMLPGNYRESVK